MTKTPTPASHAVNTAPISADLRGIEQEARECPEPSPTAGMNLGERILHVGGRENAAGYIEFGSVAAVRALVLQVLRDLPARAAPAQCLHQIAEPALQEVPFDYSLNKLSWDAIEFLSSNGAKFDGRVFNRMKTFLRDCIQQWLKDHPAAPASPAQQDAPALSPRAHFIKGWDAARMYLGMQGSADSDIAMRKYMAAIAESYVDAPHAAPAQAQQDSPAAQPSRECLQQSAADDLHAAIMNLPCEASASHFLAKAERNAYRQGHRDARHAAAELADALQAAPPAPAGVAVPTEEEIIALLGDPKYSTITAVREALRRWGTAGPARDSIESVAVRDSLRALIEAIEYTPLGLRAIRAMTKARAALAAAPAQAVAVPPDWWRKRADEIELQVALSGSTEAMRCYTDMRTLLQAATAPAQEHATQLAGQGLIDAARGLSALRAEYAQKTHNAMPGNEYWGARFAAKHQALDEALAAAPVQAQEDARDAARWRQVLRHVGGQRHTGCQTFGLVTLKPVSGNIMQGSVAEHFTKAIDAARAAQGDRNV